MLNKTVNFCNVCALGKTKGTHTLDPDTCEFGREEYLSRFDDDIDSQMGEITMLYRLDSDMESYVWSLALERDQTPLQILKSEGMIVSLPEAK